MVGRSAGETFQACKHILALLHQQVLHDLHDGLHFTQHFIAL